MGSTRAHGTEVKGDTEKLAIAALVMWMLLKKKPTTITKKAAQVEAWSSATPDRPIEMDVQVENDRVPWVWPVPSMVDRAGKIWSAVASSGFGGDRGDHKHAGQDVMYKRENSQPPRTVGDHGTRDYFAPAGTPVLAARDGRIWSTSLGSKGWMVTIDHGAPYSTMYLHLESLGIPEHARGRGPGGASPTVVNAGDVIGVMGFSPVDNAKTRHLHFEVRRGGGTSRASIDPESLQQGSWGRKTWRV